jgi:hypothetical protein
MRNEVDTFGLIEVDNIGGVQETESASDEDWDY